MVRKHLHSPNHYKNTGGDNEMPSTKLPRKLQDIRPVGIKRRVQKNTFHLELQNFLEKYDQWPSTDKWL